MGLTLHYNLSLPDVPEPDFSSKAAYLDRIGEFVKPKVEALRQRCLDLPFEEVSEIRVWEPKDFQKLEKAPFEKKQKDDWFWWFIQSGRWVNVRPGNLATGQKPQVMLRGKDLWRLPSTDLKPMYAVGFRTWPGPGCEEANFGLCFYPWQMQWDRWWYIPTKAKGWSWGSFCKTQYASDPECGGVANFLRCHMTLTAALDAAKELGFKVKVKDEGNYWKKRNPGKLAKEVGEWNEMIAGFFGAMQKAVKGTGLSIEAPITEYPNFEHLEAKGAELEQVKKLAKITAR